MTVAISSDAKWILGGFAAGFVLLGTMIVGSFLLLDNRIDAIRADMATIRADVAIIKADVATIKADVATIKSTLEVHVVEHGD